MDEQLPHPACGPYCDLVDDLRDRLKYLCEQLDSMAQAYDSVSASEESARAENEALKAEVERLRGDLADARLLALEQRAAANAAGKLEAENERLRAECGRRTRCDAGLTHQGDEQPPREQSSAESAPLSGEPASKRGTS